MLLFSWLKSIRSSGSPRKSSRRWNSVAVTAASVELLEVRQVLTGDVTAPVLTYISPLDNATEVNLNTNLVLGFNETVARGTGQIQIKKSSDNSVVQSFNVTSFSVAFDGSTVTLDPTNLAPNTSYYIEVPNTAIRDLSGNNFIGINGSHLWNFTTTTDTTAPVLNAISPLDNATNVDINTDIVLGFTEPVAKGTGFILIKKSSDNSTALTINVQNPAVTVSGSTVTINPSTLAVSTGYYIEIPNTAIVDLNGNGFIGVAGPDTWNFTTASTADATAPVLNFISPLDNAVGVPVATNIELGFTENVARGTGNIVIKKSSDNSVVQSFDIATSVAVAIVGNRVTINPTDLAANTSYYIEVPNTAIVDLSGNAFIGVAGPNTWNFTTIAGDTTAPVLNFISPLDNATEVAVTTNIEMGFTETVTRGTGNIVIKKSSDNSVVESFDVATSVAVTIVGSHVTINPTDLAPNTSYYIEVPNTAIVDLSGNAFIGIVGSHLWNFTTTTDSAAPVLTSISPLDNAIGVGINSDIVLGFNENVFKGTGNIFIRKSSDQSVAQTINILNPAVSISGSTVTIHPATFAAGTDYYIEIPNTAIRDSNGNAFIGVQGPGVWNFTTAPSALRPKVEKKLARQMQRAEKTELRTLK